MPQPPADPWLAAFTLTLVAASLAAWAYLFSRLLRRGCILPNEPRRPVPWGAPAALLAVIFVLVALSAAATAEPSQPPPVLPNPLEAAQRIIGLIFSEVVLIGGALLVVAVLSRADQRDLGLPAYVDGFVGDVGIGIVACLAAIAPVYGLLILTRYLQGQLEEPSHHPLVEMVTREPQLGVVFLASVAAVVVAPICEEIVFRLLLQGWLEKWEDARLGWREDKSNDEARMTNDEQDSSDNSSFVIRHSSISAEPLPRRSFFGLPYGWLPILISSVLFALAHFGYGPDPVPLFVLALILGYVYQRTHRIIPCMVTHALFNLVTMLALWRMVSLAPE